MGAGDPLPGLGVFRIGATVPLDDPAIEAVVQNPGPAVDLAADCRVRPRKSVRPRDAASIEVAGDRLRAFAGAELLKDPAHHGGLVRVDRPRAASVAVAWAGLVSIGDPSGYASFQDPPELAALRLLAELPQRHLGHHAHDCDMNMGDLAERGRMEANPLKRELVLKIGCVSKATAKPVDRLADDDIEATLGGLRDQLLEPGPETARAADRRVFVGSNDRPALSFGVTPAELDLIRDGGFALQVGG